MRPHFGSSIGANARCIGRTLFVTLQLLSILAALSGRVAAQTNGVWASTAASGIWSTGSNWQGTAVANGAGATADFSQQALTNAITVHLDSSRNLGNLVFGDAGNLFSWTLDNSGSSNNTLILAVASGTPSITVVNQSATISAVLAGSQGFALLGPGTNLFGPGTLAFNGTSVNIYTGATNLDSGTLLLDFSNLDAPTNLIDSTSSLQLAGGTLSVKDHSGSTATLQTFSGTALSAGASIVSVGANGNTNAGSALALGAIARSVGATVDCSLAATGSITTPTANTATSILGGWATVAGANWAVSAGNGSTPGQISALTAYTSDTGANYGWGAGNNTTVTRNESPSGGTTNSLRFNAPSSDTGSMTVSLGGTNILASGGILVTPSAGVNGALITGGTLTSGNAQFDLVVNQYDANGWLTIGSAIVDNGTNPTALHQVRLRHSLFADSLWRDQSESAILEHLFRRHVY